jgi:hypothetical protein
LVFAIIGAVFQIFGSLLGSVGFLGGGFLAYSRAR